MAEARKGRDSDELSDEDEERDEMVKVSALEY
jgi:hypothetical protein